MTASKQSLGAAVITLPASAPLVRITAGAGTAGQKSWNLRRPVTLFGARRPAHIVLHDRNICRAHCVIVQTGTEVLLKDLHTTAGTHRNDERINVVRLQNGDVITIGAMRIQVAIHDPPTVSGKTTSNNDPTGKTLRPAPVEVQLEHTDTRWTIDDAVALIGKHPSAAIRLDHDAISARHAILFRFEGEPAVYDLGSRSGVVVNGSRCILASLKAGEHLGIGPCTLRIGVQGATSAPLPPQEAGPQGDATETELPAVPDPASFRSPPATHDDQRDSSERIASQDSAGASRAGVRYEPDSTLVETEQHLDALEESIADSWQRLNNWRERIQPGTDPFEGGRQDGTALRVELDGKEAALRGLLHDLTRYHEQISARERELAEMLDGIGLEQEKLTKARLECSERNNELSTLERKLKRGENGLAQRWARLGQATCSHCGKPVRAGGTDTADALH